MMQNLINKGQISKEDATGLMGVQMLPTPSTPRAHDSENTAGKYYSTKNQKGLEIIGANPGMKLHSDFVSWMMGYPKNWTNLKLPTELTDLKA
jgi:hypothetical protein